MVLVLNQEGNNGRARVKGNVRPSREKGHRVRNSIDAK